MMISRLLINSRYLGKQVVFGSVRFVHKDELCAPPMRYVSPMGNVLGSLAVICIIMSYPTYMMYNLKNIRPLPKNQLSDELAEEVARRKELRAAGKLPVLQQPV